MPPELLHEEVQDDVELSHGALIRERIQETKLIFADWILKPNILSPFFGSTGFEMASKIGCDFGLVASPITSMDFWLLWTLFWTDLRTEDGLVDFPLVGVQFLLAMELLATANNIADDLHVRHHVPLEAGRPISGELTALMLTFLDFVLDTFALFDVGSFVVNHKMFFAFRTVELLVTPLVVVEGPGSLDALAALLAGVLLGVQVGLLLVLGKLLVTIALHGEQIAH